MTTRLDEPATGRQLHTIALLCMKHRIKELLEERAVTKGQAGKLIRRLKEGAKPPLLKEVKLVTEKRKEYKEGDIMVCPKCGSDDVDYDQAPDNAKCQSCGLEFKIRTVAIWNE